VDWCSSVRCDSARSKSMTRTMRALLSRVRRSRHPFVVGDLAGAHGGAVFGPLA
jgi:hypothetical protein